MLPKDFPPISTVEGCFYAWRDSFPWQSINHLPVMSTRELERPRSQSTGRRDLFPAIASDHLPGSGRPERQNHRKRRGLRL